MTRPKWIHRNCLKYFSYDFGERPDYHGNYDRLGFAYSCKGD